MTPITDIKNTESEIGWKPTAYLRYVETPAGPALNQKLQQLWIHSDGRDEWRDVVFAAKS